VHQSIPKRSTTKIFVGNIKDGTTNEELQTLFEPHGTVVEADVVGGYGFVVSFCFLCNVYWFMFLIITVIFKFVKVLDECA